MVVAATKQKDGVNLLLQKYKAVQLTPNYNIQIFVKYTKGLERSESFSTKGGN